MSKDFGVVISIPDLPGFVIAPGSSSHKCAFCDRMLKVSPASAELVEEGVLPACPVCVMRMSDPEEDEYIITDKVNRNVMERTGKTAKEILGGIEVDQAVFILAERTLKIEGEIEREKRGR